MLRLANICRFLRQNEIALIFTAVKRQLRSV